MKLDFETFQRLLEEKGALVDVEIEKFIPKTGKISRLNNVAWYTLCSGGKRLRSSMSLLVADMLGGNSLHASRFAVSMELLHTFLLIHDDIEDGDTFRRNEPSAWVKYGLAHALNCGDWMHSKVYEAIYSLVNLGMDMEKVIRLLREVNRTILETGEGQSIELSSRLRTDISDSVYMEIVRKKTGSYLTLPITGAAIICDCSNILIDSIKTYGQYVGPAFQIQDDIIDLTHGKGRGEIGCDIKEGKRSYLVASLSKICSPREKKALYSILNKPRTEKTASDVNEIVNLFTKYDIGKLAEAKVGELVELGKKSIYDAPPELRALLVTFADFTVKRKD
jgi:geranylgeranyl pyrophosphate synthase